MTNQDITPTPTIVPTIDPLIEVDPAIAEAIMVIDAALAQMVQRELVASSEVADLLLDVRTLLTK